MEDEQEETEYSHFGDNVFLEVLRSHLADRSWTLEQWLELERRGFGVVDGDPHLKAGIERERQKLSMSFQAALEPVRDRIFSSLAPLQQQFKDLAASISPKVNLSQLLPGTASSILTDPAYVDMSEELFPPRTYAPERRLDFSDRDRPAGETLPDIAAWRGRQMIQEAEIRKAQLETAIAATAQLKVLERLANVVTQAAKRSWYEWTVLGTAAVAAVASIVAIFVDLR